MIRNLIISGALIFFAACSPNGKETKETESNLVFDRLVGTWKLSEEDQFEQWTKNNDGSYSSRMYTVVGADTNVMEDVKIIPDAGKWNFITLVKGQNKGKAVTFTSTVLKDTLVQFENPAHDFPRIINYRLPSDNTMQAFIGGTTDTIYFNFSRVVRK
ncbi:MAG TPA: DUF6265 family protein [Bacteroidia bacterium]|jgi:hypothetical protein|nr:DUF6265 family protein [Bacteroidia bacterium]